MSNLAIIPARGGSKRIPRKNIRPFLGKPIIAYSINAAIASGCFDEIMVSTDDFEIAGLAASLGAKVPFMRSNIASADHATTPDVIFEVLNMYRDVNSSFENFCCIYPTAPFVSSFRLKTAYKKLVDLKVDSVIPITRFSYPILRSLIMDRNGYISIKWHEYIYTRSQDLETFYHDAGQFYFVNTKSFYRKKKIITENSIGIEVPESEVHDIDNEEDWKLAELKYQFLLNSHE